jgi:transporter family protein
MLWWSIFGILGKVGADRISPSQLQLFFTIGMIPVAILCAFRLRFKFVAEKSGIFYSLLMGILAALASLAFFAALQKGKASLVAPVTSLYPALTVVLAMIFLKEKLNGVQLCGLIFAMVSIVILST